MTTLFNVSGARPVPVANFEYPDLSQRSNFFLEEEERALAEMLEAPPPAAPDGFVSKEEMERKLAEALREGERRGIASAQGMIEKERTGVKMAIEAFRKELSDYFGKVEAELVSLSLAIAAKILHREAQVDRKLVAALVKVAIDELQQETEVVVRVPAEMVAEWAGFFGEASWQTRAKVQVVGDASMEPGNCALETSLGIAELGIEKQMKEIERGFFDLLAHRPDAR